MIDVLNHIDDLKKIRGLIKGGDIKTAVKQCEECIAYHQKEVEAFDKWAEAESQKDFEEVKLPFPEGVS